MDKSINIKNEIAEISKLAPFLEEIGKELSLPPNLVISLNLALEEAVSNVILYAYPQKLGEEIDINVSKREKTLIFTIKDKGVEFDPTKIPDADVSLSAEDRKIGGLGIFLIKKIMNEVSYERIEQTNVFTLKKHI